MMEIFSFFVFVTLFFQVPGKITPELTTILYNASSDEKIFVIVHMNTEYPYAQLEGMTPQEKCVVFRNIALNSQKTVIEYLKSLPDEIAEICGQFWIFNGFHLKATKDVIEELAKRDDIKFICHNGTVQIDYYPNEEVESRNPEWNISKIMADSCWLWGFSGSGVIVGHIDTGVFTTHPALDGKWLSPYWFDAVNGQSSPYDDHSHGTHTMGIICGGDGYGPFTDDVGIAYGVQYIPTKAIDASGSGQYVWIDGCMQYLADLKEQGINIRVINNSWGGSNGSDLHFWNAVLNWKNLGIFSAFANGSSGPGSGTVGSPASYPTGAGTGATDNSDNIASFSSRGPSPNISPINDPQYWYYPNWNLLKPDISAPGVNIRSCDNNGGYVSYGGSTFSVPHITGGIAVLLQKNPNLTVNELYDLLRNYCDHPSQGAPYPNNNYGWGRINVWHSLQEVPPTNQPFIVLLRNQVVNDNNGNGKLDPGEDAGIICYIKNRGGAQASNVQAKLRTTSNYITIIDSMYNYDTIYAGDSVDNSSDPFDVSTLETTPPGHMADFQLVLVSAESTWVRNFSLRVGIAPGMIIWGPKILPNFPASQFIYGVAYDRLGDRIYVLDFYSNSIRHYSSDSFVTYYGAITGPEDSLTDISYSLYDDALCVCALNPKIIWKINKTTGTILRQFSNPANDYPAGLAFKSPNTMWFADRRTALGNTQLIYIGDTMGVATQYNSPVQGYYNSRCLAYDSLGDSFVQIQTWYDGSGTVLDSVGVVEMSGTPPILTGNRFLLYPSWHIRGIEFDPRDGNYWITIVFADGARNQIVKVKGFYAPELKLEEIERAKITKQNGLTFLPNPFRNHLTIKFQIPKPKSQSASGGPNDSKIRNPQSEISLRVYDATGRLVRQWDYQTMRLSDQIIWSGDGDLGRRLPAGIYFIQFKYAEKLFLHKVVKIK